MQSCYIVDSSMTMTCNKVNISNPYLANIGDDNFHHLGLNTSSTDMKKEYSDVKVSLLGYCQQGILLFFYCLARKAHRVMFA